MERETSDQDLLAGISRGDAAAFEVLYRRHREYVYRVARRFGAGHEGALDVVQETMLYILRKAGGISLRGRMTTLLYPVAKHNAMAAVRKRRDGGGAEEREAGAGGGRGSEDGVSEELRRAIAALPEGQREVLVLRAVDGLTMEEIAAALAVPVGTVKSRLHHALNALRADPRARGLVE